MSDLVDAGEIERIVGAPRHATEHLGRAVSAEQKIYVLHSRQCLDSGTDLRDCSFSVALDRGIKGRLLWGSWRLVLDRPVPLSVSCDGWLVPDLLAPDEPADRFAITAEHLARQREFSLRAFGPGPRTEGVLDHIRRELDEVAAAPADLSEWADIIILAFDGAHRTGADPQAILDAVLAKQVRNEGRTWPDWRTAEPGKAIEHDRTADEPQVGATRGITRQGFHGVWDGKRWVPVCVVCGDEAAYCDGTRHTPAKDEPTADLRARAERAEAEVERLRDLNRRLTEDFNNLLGHVGRVEAERDALRNQVARVRAEVWSVGYQDGWSDRGHLGEDRSRNPYRQEAGGGTDE